jgi:hypothetical protein
MNLRNLGVALVAVFLLGACTVSSAFASNEYSETGGQWYTGASPGTKLTGEKALTTTAGGTLKLKTTVAGTDLDITTTGIKCDSCDITNKTSTTATADATLELTGVTVSEPAGCSVASPVKTNPLTGVVGMNTAHTITTLKLTPVSGNTIAVFELGGETCPIDGKYKLTGTIFAQAAQGTGAFVIIRGFVVGQAIQESAGTATSLKFGENPAFLTGEIKASIGGTEWAPKEK